MDKTTLAEHIKSRVLLTEEQLNMVLDLFFFKEYQKNETLLHAGQVSQYINFVLKGCLRIYFIREDGQETTRHLAFEQQYATGLTSFIKQLPAAEFIQAMEDTQVFHISRKDFFYLLDIIPAWEKYYRIYLENAYMDNIIIFQREVTRDAEMRYKELVSRNPEIVSRLSNKIVASYLNMSPETLSRIKGRK
ncbi:Crp/Fnr family transcriptional regulator [Flavobacterium sp. FlaQc-57]|uniref:Crp/Fnr family transcriptional regulator n=1 Tax=Flavobacterium sp. FlaQc-57 TaxID=3374186 RepID=UPI003757FDF8